MYDSLADYYQELVGTKEGSEYFLNLVLKYHKGSSLLDCACGSGELVEKLHEKNYQVQGFDLSEKMLEKTTKKQLFKKFSMTNFHYLESFDTIMCFCDSLNYLLKIEEVSQFFINVKKHLNPGGIFIFDMHKYAALEMFQEEYYQVGEINQQQYQWQIVAQNDLLQHTFILGNISEIHIQKIYKKEVIIELLQSLDFEVVVLDEKDVAEYALEKEVIVAKRR